MDDKQFEQQMNLLKKSYNRVPSKFKADEVLSKIEDEGQQQQNGATVDSSKTSKWQKVSVWAVSLASVFLIGILSASFINDGKEQGSEQDSAIDSKDIEELIIAYQDEKETRRESLGMTNEQFSQLGFVNRADQLFALTVDPESRANVSNSQSLDARYDQVIQYLKLPSEMINDALQGDKMNEEISMAFADELNTKIDDLIRVYNLTIDEHKEILNTAKLNGELSTQYLYNQRKNLPQEIENMIVNAPKQDITIQIAPDKTSYIAKFKMSEIVWRLDSVLVRSALELFALKNSAPYTFGGELTYEPQQSAVILEQMERVLLGIKHQNSMYAITKSYYEDLAYTLILGSTNTHVIESKKLNEEFYMAWNYLQSSQGPSPIKYFIKPVFDSMNKNDWGITETYNALNFTDLKEAFRLAETGELAALMPNTGVGLNSMTVSWPNSDLQGKAHAFLKSPNLTDGSYDYSDLSPIEAVVLFHHAQQLEFQEIMYGLTSPFAGISGIEDVIGVWKNTVLIPEGATSLRYNDSLTTAQNGSFLGVVEVMKNEQLIVSIPVVRNFEDIWQISPSILENTYEEPIVGTIDLAYQTEVEILFYEFKEDLDVTLLADKSLDIIASIYQKALQQEEFDMLYELSVKDNRFPLPTPDQFKSESNQNSELPYESFEYIPVVTVGEEEYDQIVYFDIKKEFQFGDETRKGIKMRKTIDGWRVYFEPFQ
jgi:hypothetical protein